MDDPNLITIRLFWFQAAIVVLTLQTIVLLICWLAWPVSSSARDYQKTVATQIRSWLVESKLGSFELNKATGAIEFDVPYGEVIQIPYWVRDLVKNVK